MDDSTGTFTPNARKPVYWILTAAFLALVILLAGVNPAAAQNTFPPLISLPDGFQPEGIAVGYGTTFYAGSIPTGAIYQGDLRTGEGHILVSAQAGRQATGMKFDRRTGYLFVAGAMTGQAYVYDTETGDTVEVYTLAAPGTSFINDVILTQDAAYFTDSFQPVIYKVPLRANGIPGDPSTVETIPLTGDYIHVPGGFNLNGIEAVSNGKWLIAVQSVTGMLYRIDPETGNSTLIDLGGASVSNGDGILLVGSKLYVVQNQNNLITVIDLSSDLTSGEVIGTITNGDFDVPTTIAAFGNYLYAINARFSTPPEPDTEYQVLQVTR